MSPIISVKPESAEKCKTTDITITVEEPSLSGLSNDNSYQYYLSTNSIAPEGGEWINYTNGVTQTIGKGRTGEYYLFVKRVFNTQGIGSKTNNDSEYHIYGKYIFDNLPRLKNASIEKQEESSFLGGPIKRNQIEKITLKTQETVSGKNYYDVSEEQDESILATYTDSDNNSLYEVEIIPQKENIIRANKDSSYLFANLRNITNIIGLENLETSEVTGMGQMFFYFGYEKLTKLELPENFNTLNVTDMNGMFAACGYKAMETLILPNGFDTSNVIGMNGMFSECGYTSMTILNLPENFNTSNVIDMSWMFARCGENKLTALKLSEKFNTSKVKNMAYMFYYCGYEKLTKLELPESFDTSNVTDMGGMFAACGYKAMETLTLSNKFDTSKVISMNGMFSSCGTKELKEMILPNQFNGKSVIDVGYMFNECGTNKMKKLDLGVMSFENVNNTTNMFLNTGNAETIIWTKDVEIQSYVREHKNANWINENIRARGKRYDIDTNITIDNKQITVPAGFTLSGAKGDTTTLDGGVVGYIVPKDITIDWTNENEVETARKTYDQFVWVPIDSENVVLNLSDNYSTLNDTGIKNAVSAQISQGKYPMSIQIDSDNNYIGVLYQFSLDSNTNKVKIEVNSNWTPKSSIGNREADYLEDEKFADGSSYNDTSPKITKNLLQSEFNTMIKNVKNNEGFWIGRYETSNMNSNNTNDTTNKVKIIKGTDIGINNVDWYRMYAQQKNYSKLALGSTTTKTSSMIWGSQWDQVIIWMKNVENKTKNSYYVVNSLGMGNYGTSDDTDTNTSAPAKTGNSENYKVKNIYDMAGNVRDWTLEAFSTNVRILRRRNL